MEITSDSVQKTLKIASDLAKELKKGDIIALRGQLGAGKTVFVKGLARGLGIKQEIKSPTFVFEKRYPIVVDNEKIIFHHLDLYRGDSINDLLTLGLNEIISDDSIVVLEWADKIEENLPKSRIDITIKVIDETKRSITIERH